jgi:AcrR family transcriptional regulator
VTEPGLRDRKKQQTRAALIDAALRLVDERGFDKVTVEDISAAAEVSSRTFFNYFATKDEALFGDRVGDEIGMHERLLAADPELPVLGAILQASWPILADMEIERENWIRRIRVMKQNPSLVVALMVRSERIEGDLVAAIAQRAGVRPDSGFPVLAAVVSGAAYRAALIRWAGDREQRHTLIEYVNEAFGTLAAGLPDPTREDGS